MPQLKSDAFAHEREQYLAKLLPELFEGRLVPFNERPMVLNAIQRSTTTQMMSSGKSAPSRNRSIRGSSATSLSTNNPRQMLQGAQPFTDISDKSTLPEAAQITDISPGHSNAEKGKTKSRPPLHVPKWTTAHDKNDGHPLNLLELKVAQGVVGMKLNVLGKVRNDGIFKQIFVLVSFS